MLKLEKPKISYDTLLDHVQTLGIPVFDFVNHLPPITLEDRIGHGAAMTVYKSLLRRHSQQNPIKVALKIPNQNVKETSKDGVISGMIADIRQEIRIMKHLETHPYVVTLYGITFRDLKPILVVELATSSLSDYLVSKMADGIRVKWETKARFCYEVAEGIKALHIVGIVHGDIKAENTLLFGDSEDENELISKISDFGYSSTVASIASGKGTGGTPNFWAPECAYIAPLEMKPYANKSTKDNYSYGLYVWQVATDGEIPYEGMDIEDIDEAKHSDRQLLELMKLLPEDTPEPFKEVITAMTRYEPTKREDLMNVKAIMSSVDNIDFNKDDGCTEAKKAFEANMKILQQDTGGINLKSLRSMQIPPSIKKRIFRTYEVAASKGDAEAASFLSICYGSGFGVKFDKTKMISSAIQAAEGGNLEAVKTIASSYSIKIEELQGCNLLFPWILQTAEAGHKDSQFFISSCYEEGVYIDKDIIKYEEWKTKYLNNSLHYDNSTLPEESPLHSAAREGNTEAIKFFIQQEGMDANTRNSSGITPLYLATVYGHVDVMSALIDEFGAEVNIKDIEGRVPLHVAALLGKNDTLNILATRFGAIVNVQDNDGKTPLHLAAQYGLEDTVRLLVGKCGADINARDNDGWTPLHLATQDGHIVTVELLVVKFGADIDSKNNTGWTSLHLAAQYGHVDITKMLAVRFGADIHAKSDCGMVPLHSAAYRGHSDIVKLIIVQFEIDVNIQNNNGWTPLHCAAQDGYVNTVKLLASKLGADTNIISDIGRTPLHLAAQNGHVETVKLLVVELGADMNAKENDGWTPLHLAAENGHVGVVKLLLRANVNAQNNSGWTPLHLATKDGHVDTVKLLVVELGSTKDVKNNIGQTPLLLAVQNGHADIVKFLLVEHGADVNVKDNNGWTPLHIAAQNGHIDTVKLFVIEFGADVNAKSNAGRTPLHLAAFGGHVGIAKLFVVEYGADVNAKENQGHIALHFAAQNGHIDTVALLAGQLGTDLSINNNNGQSSLHLAAIKGHIDIVKLLVIELGADSNVKASDGWTPLHLAAQFGHVNIVKLLVMELGADVEAKSDTDWTPLSLAAFSGHIDIVNLLVADFGADINAKINTGWTPLHLVAYKGYIDIARLLMDLGADVNATDCKGLTPLLCCGNQTSMEMALALSENPRANIYAKTDDGQTLLHFAVKSRQKTIVKMLIEQFHLDIYEKDSNGKTPLELADEPPVHFTYACDGCKKSPVIGELHKCTVCGDFGFCSVCYGTVDHYNNQHVFKIVELPSVKHLLVPF